MVEYLPNMPKALGSIKEEEEKEEKEEEKERKRRKRKKRIWSSNLFIVSTTGVPTTSM